MKTFIFTIFFVSSFSVVMAQIPEVKKKNCYDRAAAVNKQRFASWECGKLAGYIDCNEELDYDEESNTVLKKAKDQVNITGAGLPYTGGCETCFPNGLLERRITFVNGKENGVDSTYYKSGCLQVVRNHIQGAESGMWTYLYDSTGNVAWEMNYNLGQKHGRQIYFTKGSEGKSGDTTKVEHYSNGVLNGVKKTYFPKSKLEKEVNYVNGLMDGAYKAFNYDGKLIQEFSYKAGKKNGECKFYYNDGTLLSTEHWTMDVKDGEFKTFYYNGLIQTMENYKKGIQEGWFEERWPDDKLKRRALYKKGVLIEEHRYDEQGNENYTFGVETISSTEDDAMPSSKKKKTKKKKKSKGETENGGVIKVE
ncbi:MAG: toxin-antitoxin system YwqK family antitoxin [Crocinitomicaceae bacterium]|nr:toxin-antitoxin system YwqK family antitoxin [Crocinitomicaceae bacterium]